LVWSLGACASTWVRQPTQPAELLSGDQHNIVRLTLIDGSRLVLRQPRVIADSVRGQNPAGSRVAIPLPEVSYVSTLKTSDQSTLVVLALVVGAIALLAWGFSGLAFPT